MGVDFSSQISQAFTQASSAISTAAKDVSELNKNVGEVFSKVMQQVQGAFTAKPADVRENEVTNLCSQLKSLDPETKPSLAVASGIAMELSNEVSDAAQGAQTTRAQQTPDKTEARQTGAKKAIGDLVRSKVLFPLSGQQNTHASARLQEVVTDFSANNNKAGQKAEVKKIPVNVGEQTRELEALHMTHGDDKSRPTVVVFHANADTAAKYDASSKILS